MAIRGKVEEGEGKEGKEAVIRSRSSRVESSRREEVAG